MTIRISNLKTGDVRPFTFEWAGDEINLHYRPAEYTADFEDAIQGLIETNRKVGANARALHELLVSWDVENDEGKPWPPTLENLRTLKVELTEALLQALLEDAKRPAPPSTNGHSTDVPDAPRRARR